MENTWMCQPRTSASFQRWKIFRFCFFTFCLLSSLDLLTAPDLLASPAAGNEASLGTGLSGHWTSSWKLFVRDFFLYFLPQEDLKFLHEQPIAEKPKTLKELVPFPSSAAWKAQQFLCPRCQSRAWGSSSPTRCCRDAALELSVRSSSAAMK